MSDMKSIRNPSKADIILNMFDEVGTSFTVEEVCSISGVKGYNSLKAMLCYMRKAKHIPDESRIDVRIKDGNCVRVN